MNAEPDELTLWDPASGREALPLTGHVGYMTGAFFTPDGNRLIVTGADGTVYIWEGAPLPEVPAKRPEAREPERHDADVP